MNNIKDEWINYLKSISTPVEQCNYTTWLTDDGKMFEIQGEHAKVSGFITKNTIRHIKIDPTELDMNTIFAINTNCIRLAGYPTEITMELKRKQQFPTEQQRQIIKNSFCNDNRKKYFQYQFTELDHIEHGVIEKDIEDIPRCDIEIDKIFQKFEKFKNS